MKTEEQIYFEEHLQKAYGLISRQHIEVQQYALNEKASQVIIDKRLRDIAEIKQFLDTAQEFVKNLEDQDTKIKEYYYKGYDRGCEETKKRYEFEPHPTDRERVRLHNINKCKNDFPNLF